MKKDELIQLKDLVNKEIIKRERIKELLKNDLVREYLKIAEIEPIELDSNNIEEIVNQILSTIKITKTNGIYVCTSSYYMDYGICYDDSECAAKDVLINSDKAEYRIYTDIESGSRFQAARDSKNSFLLKTLMMDFESNNIVLNPYNTVNNQNGYNEVRMNFFKNAIEYGQTKSKQLILEKYPRL